MCGKSMLYCVVWKRHAPNVYKQNHSTTSVKISDSVSVDGQSVRAVNTAVPRTSISHYEHGLSSQSGTLPLKTSLQSKILRTWTDIVTSAITSLKTVQAYTVLATRVITLLLTAYSFIRYAMHFTVDTPRVKNLITEGNLSFANERRVALFAA